MSHTPNDSEGNKLKPNLLTVTKFILIGVNCNFTSAYANHIPNSSLYLTTHDGGEILGEDVEHTNGLKKFNTKVLMHEKLIEILTTLFLFL
jgi:hypothetical protein